MAPGHKSRQLMKNAKLLSCLVTSEVMTAMCMNLAVIWDVAPCSAIEVGRRFSEVNFMVMDAVRSSQTSANFYQTTWCSSSEDNRFHVKSYWIVYLYGY